MDDRARQIAHLFLREGCLRRQDSEHQEVYGELMGNTNLYDDVKLRLSEVGYELDQWLGHIGIRAAHDALLDLASRNRMQLNAGHIRLITYLWVQLVYREWLNLRNDDNAAPPGAEQADFFEQDETVWIAYREVFAEFSESMSKSYLKGLLSALARWRFIRIDEKRNKIWAESSLYILIDRHRMEEFVIDIARRLGADNPTAAVTSVATGSAVAEDSAPTGKGK